MLQLDVKYAYLTSFKNCGIGVHSQAKFNGIDLKLRKRRKNLSLPAVRNSIFRPSNEFFSSGRKQLSSEINFKIGILEL